MGHVQSAHAQCSAVVEIYNIPSSVEICEFTFPAEFEATTYLAVETLIVSISYKTDFVTIANTDQLTNVSTVSNGNNSETVTGTWIVDTPIGGGVYSEHLNLEFNRVGTSLEKIGFTFRNISCVPPSVTTFEVPIHLADGYTDLRNAPSNSLLWLVINDWLDYCDPNVPFQGFSNNILVGDELIVDTDFCFWNPSSPGSIVLMPGAKITVASGYKLDIDNVNIFSCGDELAQGIVVESGATLNIKNSKIADCRFGIDLKPGAILSIENNDFVDNYIGTNFNMTIAPFNTTINSFEGNNFYTELGVKSPFAGMPEQTETRGYCGILVNNYKDFNLWGAGNPNVSDGNHFSALANGLIGRNTPTNMRNMTFDDMNSVGAQVYPLEGFGIYLSSRGGPYWANLSDTWLPTSTFSFNNCKVGVKATHYGGGVFNALMTNVGVGIDWERSQGHLLTFQNNVITARDGGIRSFRNEPTNLQSIMDNNTITITGGGAGANPATGIRMNEGGYGIFQGGPGNPDDSGWTLNENHITLQNGGRGIHYRLGLSGLLRVNEVNNLAQTNNYDGIWTDGSSFSTIGANIVTQSLAGSGLGDSRAIRSAGGFANTFIANCVDNTNAGLQFYDMADFTDNVLTNSMNTHITGLQLGDDVQGNVFIGDQHHTGNVWDLGQIPGSGFGGVHWGGQFVAQASQFFVDEVENPSFNPPVDPGSLWFMPESTPEPTPINENGCSFPNLIPESPNTKEGDVPTGLDAAIVGDSLPSDGYGSEMSWKGKYRLYRKLLRRPAIVSNATEYAAFKSANANLSTGRLAYIAEEKSKLFTQTSSAETYRVTLVQRQTNINALDSLRQSGGTVNGTTYALLQLQRDSALVLYEHVLDAQDSLRLLKIQVLLALNDSVTTSMDIEANHKVVNAITLGLLASEEDTLATSDLEALTAIAGQCPMAGGDAVYEARAVVSHFTGQEFDDHQLCGAERPSKRREGSPKAKLIERLTVFPNPTTGILMWSGIEGSVLVKVFNHLGQLQVEKEVSDSQVSLSKLPEGMYIVQFRSQNGELLSNSKVTLLKH